MSFAHPSSSLLGRAVVVLGGLVSLLGCQTMGTPAGPPTQAHEAAMQEAAPVEMAPPRELQKMTLPCYRVEPPDVLQIEVTKVVPLPPYRLEVYDVLQIEVLGALAEQPIANLFMVEVDGMVNFGPTYGRVRLLGLSVDEASLAIQRHLGQVLRTPQVSLRLVQATGVQPVSGVFLVGPDGTVNLRSYGQVGVAGMTLAEAKLTLQQHLSRFLESPNVTVDVVSYNSKVYYIITQGAGLGDSIVRVPITGNETVLDALSQIQGFSQVSSKEVWIARPAPQGSHCEQVLPVDWVAITQGGSTGTNYQILPGDRVYIAEDHTIATTNFISKILSPFERIVGFAGLTGTTVRTYKNLNTPYGSGY